MPISRCHICNQDKPSRRTRAQGEFRCPFCFEKVERLCCDCARWFFGYKDTTLQLPDPLKKPDRRAVVDSTAVPCPISPARSASQEQAYSKKKGQLCKTVEGQFRDPDFEQKVKTAWTLWDALYMPADVTTATTDERNRQTLMHTAILLTFSSEALCVNNTDGTFHRHDAPKIAHKHAEVCFSAEEWCPSGKMPFLQALVGQAIIERFLKKKIILGTARKLSSGIPPLGTHVAYPNENEKQALMALSAQLFQVTFVGRALSTKRDIFNPVKAHGYFSEKDKELIFEDGVEPYFSAGAEYDLSSLHSALGRSSTLSPLFGDPSIDATLPELTRDFLNMLPRMDTTGSDSASRRSACESAVRRKVISQIKTVFQDPHGKLDAEVVAQFSEISRQFLGVAASDPVYVFETETKQNEETRMVFGVAADNSVLAEHWEALLDALVLDLNGTQVYIEHSFNPGLTEVLARNWSGTTLKSDYQLHEKDVKWGTILPKCMPSGDTSTAFKGVNMSPKSLEQHDDGRAGYSGWYWDWRIDKDYCLYDGFVPSIGGELGYTVADYSHMPVFTSLSPCAGPPLPNYTSYGASTIVFKPGSIRNRCIFTLGDKMPPRRSMLMLLFDLLYAVPFKYGDGTTTKGHRQQYFFGLLYHLDKHVADYSQTKTDSVLRQDIQSAWTGYRVTNSYQYVATDPPYAVYSSVALLFECHVFGEVKPSRDAVAVLVSRHSIHNIEDGQAQNLQIAIARQDSCAVKLYDFKKVTHAGIPKIRQKFSQPCDAKVLDQNSSLLQNLDGYLKG